MTAALAAGFASAAEPVRFVEDVQPILERRCTMCHGSEGGQAELSAATQAALLQGGVSGPAVVPGNPDRSLLIQAISGDKPSMPKVGGPLNTEEVALIRRWIAEGAKPGSPSDEAAAPGRWWSFRPLETPIVPDGDVAWSRTTIDRFVSAKLAEKGLVASAEADRRTLVRRLTYDLHGLPPTPEEVEAFVHDSSADAYEKLVDRLLASPRYGERWGRHWLDVVHYGESHGYDKDKPRRNAWPYRDYVIDSFNQDKPYARFVQEQLAGDVLWPRDPQGLIATGFIAAGPWDYVGHAELREGTKDKKIARLLDRDDMIAATMSTFTSLTVHCARCHDHKFDPIKQEDYYSLQAVFAGVDRADQPFDRDPEAFVLRRALWSRLGEASARLEPLLQAVRDQTSPEIARNEDQSSALRSESADLLPKVGEVDTPETIARREEIGKLLAELGRQRDELARARLDPDTRAQLERLESERKAIEKEFDALPEPEMVYSAASYFKPYGNFAPAWEPRPVDLLDRGSVESPLRPVGPGAVSAVKELPARFEDAESEGARRAALAAWITARENPLTWRSIVNRVWHYHFGEGLVDSPNDFGRMGGTPVHPELLDWLAIEFRDGGGSMKNLHRLILTSAVYRQSSAHHPANAKVDAANQFLWRMNRRRLDAEAVRDSALYVNGRLDLTMGGPSAEQFFFKDDHSPVYDYARFDFDSPAARRRSVYRFLVRSVQDPFMESLDCADPSLLVPKRNATLTAVQALALMNDPLMVQESQFLAERLEAHSGDVSDQIEFGYQLTVGRAPGEEESRLLAAYARKHGLASAARLMLNSNEFIFVD